MSDSGTWIEIVLLAMLAGFIGLRLVSVLGKRTGSEKPVGDAFRPGSPAIVPVSSSRVEAPTRRLVAVPAGTGAELAPALQAVGDVDPNFDPEKFVAGAQAAYRMILEAYWAGDAAVMDGLVSDEVATHFKRAIDQRGGASLANKLVRIDAAAITAAQMVGQMAEVTVRFDADIVAADTDGASTADAETHDVWTFSRHVGTYDPAWLLIATDVH
jgi:predicted lipid-binding transport protein (Tim44 family)